MTLILMFRHNPAPRDTSVLREIIIVDCESVGNCQNLFKDGPLQLVNNIIFRPFFFSLRSMALLVLHQGALYIVFIFINRQLFI